MPVLHKAGPAQAHQATMALYHSVAVEQALGVLVLAIVAILGTTYRHDKD